MKKMQTLDRKTEENKDPVSQNRLESQQKLGNSMLLQKTGLGREQAGSVFQQAIQGPGSSLPYQSEMEQFFGESFGGVNVYFGRKKEMDALGANAAAYGQDIVFAEQNPSKELVAHELTHTLQQKGSSETLQGATPIGGRNDPAEKEADKVSNQMGIGASAGSIAASGNGIHLDEKGPRGGTEKVQDVTVGVGTILNVEAILRETYQRTDQAIFEEAQYMLQKGVPAQEVAKWTVEARNVAKVKIRRWNLDVLRLLAEQRNSKPFGKGGYGNKVGPTYEQLKSGSPNGRVRPKTDTQIIEGAARSNAKVNRWAGRMKIAGRIMIFIDIGISGYKVYSAPPKDRPKVFFQEAGALAGAAGGGWAGAKAGGAMGAYFGPWGAGIGAVVGGISGAIGGGWAGSKAGTWMVDQLYPTQDTFIDGDFK